MRYLSICSGIEAASVAWEPVGWTPAGFAEIDRFPSAVLAHHWPHVPNFGDFTTIRSEDAGSVDLIVGGTPCQSFSVAGLRKGLGDERGNLALEFCLLVSRLRPRWVLWENVPGVLSLEGGQAFASILGGLVQCGYGVAYRVLDAQYFGLAQRRKRVFVVGHLGDWRRAAAVLFERESLSRNSPPRRETGQRTAPTISARPTGGGGLGTDFDRDGGLIPLPEVDVVGTLSDGAHMDGGLNGQDAYSGRILPVAYRTSPNCGVWETGDRTDALTTATDPNSHIVAFSCKDHGADAGDLSPSLRAMGHDGSHANAGGQVAVAFDTTQVTSKANRSNPKSGDPCHPLAAGAHAPAVAFNVSPGKGHKKDDLHVTAADTSKTIDAHAGNPTLHQSGTFLAHQWAVRRLTPEECETLQGFSRGFTRIPYRGKPASECPDGPRYKSLGNSFAVPVVRWIGKRIALCDEVS